MSVIHEVLRIVVFIWEAVVHVWPLLLITIPLAVVMKSMNISDSVHKLFSKNIWLSILLATLVGAVSPFCSCGVIPVILALLTAGVPIAPVMSFWLASPSMDPEIFFLSVGSLGLPLAIARMTATFLMSLSGGIIVHFMYGRESVNDFLLIKPAHSELAHSKPAHSTQTDLFPVVDTAENKTKCCIGKKDLIRNVVSSTIFVLKFMVIAYFLEALIVFYLPQSVVTIFLNAPDYISILIASGVSIPLYTTNISALGLVSGLLDKGLSAGAALSFLVGGATTTIPAMAAVYKIVDKRIFKVYIGIAISFSILSGLIFTLIEQMIV